MDFREISEDVALVQDTVVFLKLLQNEVFRSLASPRVDQGLHIAMVLCCA